MIKVYGSSDDLIEVKGDITEEFNGDGSFLVFSDGTVLHVFYGNEGVWRILYVAIGESSVDIDRVMIDNPNSYTDVATVNGSIRWVAQCTTIATNDQTITA